MTGKASKPKIGLVTGGFDPLHQGHLRLFQDAAPHCDHLCVGINRDEWLVRKKGFRLLDERTRLAVLSKIRGVTMAFLFDADSQGGASKAIYFLKDYWPSGKVIMMNGGDRNANNVPSLELQAADETIWGVGGDYKLASSSDIFMGALQSFKARDTID